VSCAFAHQTLDLKPSSTLASRALSALSVYDESPQQQKTQAQFMNFNIERKLSEQCVKG
jgi:hypothetical protein